MSVTIEQLRATAETLRSTGGRVWIAEQSATPHIRVYWDSDYVRVDEDETGYNYDYVGKGSVKRDRCLAKVEAALGT